MQLLERVRNYEFLGREFLVWLWYQSDINEGRFSLGEAGHAELWFDDRVVLQANDNSTEKIICLGENTHLREARFRGHAQIEHWRQCMVLYPGFHLDEFQILQNTQGGAGQRGGS